MPKQKTDENYQNIINQLASNTVELLTEYYARANALRDSKDTIKIAITHRVSNNQFGEIITNSQIGFGKRIKDTVEHTVDTTAQFDFGDAKPVPVETKSRKVKPEKVEEEGPATPEIKPAAA